MVWLVDALLAAAKSRVIQCNRAANGSNFLCPLSHVQEIELVTGKIQRDNTRRCQQICCECAVIQALTFMRAELPERLHSNGTALNASRQSCCNSKGCNIQEGAHTQLVDPAEQRGQAHTQWARTPELSRLQPNCPAQSSSFALTWFGAGWLPTIELSIVGLVVL